MNTPIQAPSTTDSQQSAAELLAEARKIDEAIRNVRAEIAESKSSIDSLNAAQASRDVDAALASPDDRAKLEKTSSSALKKIAEAQSDIDRKKAVVEAIFERARAIDSQLMVEVQILEGDVRHLAQAELDKLDAEIFEAARPLLALLGRVAMVASATRTSGLYSTLSRYTIPMVSDPRHLLRDGQIFDGAQTVPIDHLWRADPALVNRHDELAQPSLTLASLKTHKPVEERHRVVAPYLRKGDMIELDARGRAIA